MRWLAGFPDARLPALAELDTRADGEALRTCCMHLAKASLLAFDRAELERVLAVHAALLARPEEDGEWRLSRSWLAIASGQADRLDDDLERFERDAALQQRAALVIELAATRALAAEARDDFDVALRLARRASRMARSEALPQPEYFANTVLARIRRRSGAPHLATRILSALRSVASPPWFGWLDWELTMAAGSFAAGARPITWPAAALQSSLADCGGPAWRDVHAAVETWAPARSDALLAHLSVGGTLVAESRVAPAFVDWLRGTSNKLPFGLEGLSAGAEDPQVLASVRVDANGHAVRVLSIGAQAIAARLAMDQLPQSPRQFGRTDALLAALALGGTGAQAELELFARVYGFKYSPAVHQDVFAVLIHRARERLGPRGEIVRASGQLKLRVDRPFVVPDPRCTQSSAGRALQFLAQNRHATAREVAERLAIPLRTAQASLRELVEDGMCGQRREGRNVSYFVEDSTFQEPTQSSARRV
jgi:hypothetical protein